MLVHARGLARFPSNATVIRMRCPGCQHNGTFEPVAGEDVQSAEEGILVVIRRCPSPACRALVAVMYTNGAVVASYPPELIDFDAADIPEPIAHALEEAISDHANECYVSAAIMVRKTLELMCHDRGAEGDNLKQRIGALANKVVLPAELFAGMDDLRLLGNDAAHIDSEVFNQVGREEVEVGIAFTKEVLKATYQYAQLVQRLKALKKPPAP